jgi:hypothetical protein
MPVEIEVQRDQREQSLQPVADALFSAGFEPP